MRRIVRAVISALLLTAGSAFAACSGVQVPANASGATIQSLINAQPNGTTFCFVPGTSVLTGYITLRFGNRLICEPRRTCIITGNNANPGGFRVDFGTDNVLIKGFVVKDFTTPSGFPEACMQARNNGVMEDNEITNCNTGMSLTSGNTAKNNYLHHNRCHGVDGGPGTTMYLSGNEIAYNNTSHADPGDDCAGVKIIGSQQGANNLTWYGNYVHHNYGNGLWCDGNCRNLRYEGNRVENNEGCGIDHEISWDVVITRNVFLNNGGNDAAGQSCFHGGSICVNNSQGVTITGNRVIQRDGLNGICLNHSTRPNDTATWFPQSLANVSVTGNWVYTWGAGRSGVTGNPSSGISFEGNTYYTQSEDSLSWDLYGAKNQTQWQAGGMDATGVFNVWDGIIQFHLTDPGGLLISPDS